MSARYELLPTIDTSFSSFSPSSPYSRNSDSPSRSPVAFHYKSADDEEQFFRERDSRFDQPTPSPWARAALLAFIVFMFWLALRLRRAVWEDGEGVRV